MAFIALSTIQIEGLFSEYLKILDPEYKEGTITLVPKLNRINEKKFFYGYEYFTFEFPRLRNQMAHGGVLEDDNIKQIADEMLMDLRYVISVFNDNELDPNIVFRIMDEEIELNERTLKGIGLLTCNEYIKRYIFTNEKIYKSHIQKSEEIRNNILNDKFWEYFKEIVSKYKFNEKFILYGEFIDLKKTINVLRDISKEYYSNSDYKFIFDKCKEMNVLLGKLEKEKRDKNSKIQNLIKRNEDKILKN